MISPISAYSPKVPNKASKTRVPFSGENKEKSKSSTGIKLAGGGLLALGGMLLGEFFANKVLDDMNDKKSDKIINHDVTNAENIIKDMNNLAVDLAKDDLLIPEIKEELKSGAKKAAKNVRKKVMKAVK